ncbi:hypothetical protein GLOIN_2v1779093 [Rhizophagus irregularis DAOM 181602=DAOM 197198]|nr:hypothetical protein GLOIN_2v1779093 [Rhizophagus irregularis DAOM 181602=DAOM 197198]
MENVLQHCLPLVRFFGLSSEDFFQKVRPYKKLLKNQLYEELLESYLNPNSEPNDNILLPRYRNIDGIVNSKIVNLNIASLISRWMDKINIKSKYIYTRELYLPYEFKLLLRGCKDGFTPKKFHKLCDNIPHTNNFKDQILSHVENMSNALFYHTKYGPLFGGGDINIFVFENYDSKDFDQCYCRQRNYEKKIRDTVDKFMNFSKYL